MIRVGFMMADRSDGWLGGINYRRNLLTSILLNADRRIDPVLILAPGTDERLLADFPPMEVIRSALADPGSRWRKAGKIARRLTGRDIALETFLRRHRIDVLSHSATLGRRSPLASISWIPDFQHRRMPDYFSAGQLAERDGQFGRMIADSTTVIVSSADALGDLAAFVPGSERRARVLHFVSGLLDTPDPVPRAALEREFGFAGAYLHLPNQFWIHKNHAVVIEALAVLKARGTPALVLATGKAADPRDPAHYDRLMARAAELGVADMFRPLGVVAQADLHALMLNAVAIINPSRFEGWSSTVEEAKSLGKRILLSDIPVHREQAPALGRYFDPDSPEMLADAIAEVLAGHDPATDATLQAQAAATLPERARAFGRAFEGIAIEAADAR